MELFRKVSLELILPLDFDNRFSEFGKLYAGFCFGSTQDAFSNELSKSVTSGGVKFADRGGWNAEEQPIRVKVSLSVVDGSTSDHPDDVGLQSLNALEEGILVAEVVCFIEDDAIPGECMEGSEYLVFRGGGGSARGFERCGKHVIGCDDDRSF